MDARDVNGDVDGVRTQAAARDFVSTLLAPVGWDGFVSDYFDSQPLHVSLGPEAFEGWATPHAVRELIEAGVPWQFRRMPEVYLEGGRVPHHDIVDTYVDMDGREARTPRLGRIRSLMSAGATVNAFGQESHFPKLATLRRHFAGAFAAEVEVATFYSQQDHPGLSPHYDCVEIFVLQIQGCKRWHVSSQRVAAPIVGYGEATLYEPQAPHAQLDLEPGDVLYLPRGTFHHACATTAESLHATVAVKLPTYLDMLHALASHAPDSDAVRAYLPLSGAADSAAAKRSLLEALSATVATNEFDCVLDRALRTRAGLWSGR